MTLTRRLFKSLPSSIRIFSHFISRWKTPTECMWIAASTSCLMMSWRAQKQALHKCGSSINLKVTFSKQPPYLHQRNMQGMMIHVVEQGPAVDWSLHDQDNLLTQIAPVQQVNGSRFSLWLSSCCYQHKEHLFWYHVLLPIYVLMWGWTKTH